MAEFDFNFCENSRVIETLAPEETVIRDFNGWDYTPNPILPYRRRFKVTLEGLRWYTRANGSIDTGHNPDYNAYRLEDFYARHRRHKPFNLAHPWLGFLEVRFDGPVNVPKAIPNSGGLIESVEVTMIHHNPRY